MMLNDQRIYQALIAVLPHIEGSDVAASIIITSLKLRAVFRKHLDQDKTSARSAMYIDAQNDWDGYDSVGLDLREDISEAIADCQEHKVRLVSPLSFAVLTKSYSASAICKNTSSTTRMKLPKA